MPATGACYYKDPQTGQILCQSPVTEVKCQSLDGIWVEDHNCDAVQSTATSAQLAAGLTDAVDKAMAKDADASRAAVADAMRALTNIAKS